MLIGLTNLFSTAILNVFKDSLDINRFVVCYVLPKLETFFNCNYNDTSCLYLAAKSLR